MNTLKDFSIGDRVILKDSVLHKDFAGQQGTVSKTIKRRNVVRVFFEDGSYYDALPENLKKEG